MAFADCSKLCCHGDPANLYFMVKNKKKKKGGYTPSVPSAQDIVESIVVIAEKIKSTEHPGSLWGDLHKAFLKSEIDSSLAAKIIMHKDLDELGKAGTEVAIEEKETAVLPALNHETIVDALRIFRKRIKFMKLDHESKLGVGPLSGGKEMKFDSMAPPHDYPVEVWKALAVAGHLIDDGGGFYRLPE